MCHADSFISGKEVMPRKRHVSRNFLVEEGALFLQVMPRKRHVSRNVAEKVQMSIFDRHASQEACE